MDNLTKRYLSISEFAVRFGLSRKTVERRIASCDIPAVQIGKNGPWRIPLDELEASLLRYFPDEPADAEHKESP